MKKGDAVQYDHPTDGASHGIITDTMQAGDQAVASVHKHTRADDGTLSPTNPPVYHLMSLNNLRPYSKDMPALPRGSVNSYGLMGMMDGMKSSPRIDVIASFPKKGDPANVEYKAIMGSPQSIDDASRTVIGLGAVFGNVDEVGDVLHPGSFKKTLSDRPAGRIPYLWQHDIDAPPIAVIQDIKEIDRRDLPADVQRDYPDATGGVVVARRYLTNARADEIYEGVKEGATAGMSFGFDAVKKEFSRRGEKSIRGLKEVKLYEFSDTPIPANSATRAVKSALAFHDGPMEDKEAPWNGPAEVAKADVEQLKKMCAWVDPEKADVKDGYKFPYKTADGKLNFKAAAAGFARLNQADIPPEDRKKVAAVLAKVYEKFGEEPPDQKALEIAWTVSDARRLIGLGVEFKVGRRNSAADEEKIKRVIDMLEQGLETLEDLLNITEPPDEEAAESTSNEKALLTRRALLQRLDIASRDPLVLGV